MFITILGVKVAHVTRTLKRKSQINHFKLFLDCEFASASNEGRGSYGPWKGWIIFSGNSTFNQTQHLQSIDGTWSIGDPPFEPEINICIVQVMKTGELRFSRFYNSRF
jgi:hypothetical protein